MPRYRNINSAGSCIPDMLKQLHPRTGGLRWLGVPYVISPTHARFTGQPPNRRSSRLGTIAQGVIRIGRHSVRPPVHRARLLALQAAAYPLMARRGSLLAQFAKNSIAPIAARAACMDRGNLHVKNRVGEGPRAWWPFSPLAIAGTRYRRQPAHPGDGKPVAMRVDPGVLHRDPLAKYAAANGMVRPLLKANARGYRNFAQYRIAILFHCGKLDLYPSACAL